MFPDREKVCGRKRQREISQDFTPDKPVTKKRNCSVGNQAPWSPTPTFWDTLSKAHLTRLGLKEFDRRIANNKAQQQLPRATACVKSRPLTRSTLRQLRRLVKDGEPDLSHLRGFANLCTEMSKRTRNSRHSTISGHNPSTKTPRSAPYQADFEQKLFDAGVYLNGKASKPVNLQEIHDRLAVRRSSLSTSRFDDDQFEAFQESCEKSDRETKVMQAVFSVIEGTGHKYNSSGDALFCRAKPFAEGLAFAKPDLFDGVSQRDVQKRIRLDLSSQIVLTKSVNDPIAPNFFTEGKSAQGTIKVAKRQVGHDGAIGARAMHALQNYGKETVVYDGRAYSFTSIFLDGALKLYAHHPTAPQELEGNSEYHMTQLRSFSIADTAERFREGVSAYRHLRDYAMEQRDLIVDQANKRALTMSTSTSSSKAISTPTIRTDSFAESDTSIDELARDEVFHKRARLDPQGGNRSICSGLQYSQQPSNDRRASTTLNKANIQSLAEKAG